jgi:Xaa-Pro dipeptidase
MSKTLAELFADHLVQRRAGLDEDLEAAGYDALVISAGRPLRYFADDQEPAFHPTPHFRHWCPVEGPHHLLALRRGARPRLIRHAAEDFWYEPAPLGDPFWRAGFEIAEAATVDEVWAQLGPRGRTAYLGDEPERAGGAGLDPNPEKLLPRLDWRRAIKSDYEVRCLEQATAIAARGHEAARNAFLAGGSELEIHHAYVRALGTTDAQLPYGTIVALDEKGAFLHYEAKRDLRDGRVLLIDAGASTRGYGSDITRTHTRPGCDERFVALRDGMESLQQSLCDEIRPGLPFGELHHRAHLALARLLAERKLLDADPEDAVEKGWTRPFLPHGLGHQLGVQVHDVGGHLAGPDGTAAPPPPQYPSLRNTRTIEVGHVFTVEPGLYFIEMLLRPLRAGADRERFNWTEIDALMPFGGIRIEDDVLVKPDGVRNLTREHLP